MSQANKVFVGNLPEKVKESEVREKFEKFGKIVSISVKTPTRPPAFAFIEFEDVRDAEDAVRELNGTDFEGNQLRVEITKRGPRGQDGRRDDDRDDRRGRRQHGTVHRISISGLSSDTSWQDLKDFLREAGDVAHSEVDRRGHGTASFQTAEQMDRAIRKLDDQELKGRHIRIREEYRSRSRSRTPPRRRRRSYSRSWSRSRTPPRRSRRSDSRSPRRRRSRS